MKILFCYFNVTKQVSPQLGIAILSAVAKKVGFSTDLFDLTVYEPHENDKKLFRNKINEFKPDILAVSCRSNEWSYIEDIFTSIVIEKKIIKIFGGPHATTSPEEVLKFADIAVIGEGEETFEDILANIKENNNISSITGTWSRTKSGLKNNGIRRLIENLDELPTPDWEIFNDIHFSNHFLESKKKSKQIIGTFELSRGCPYACTYCTNSYMKKLYNDKGKWRRIKSPKKIVNEINDFKQIYGLDYVYWIDEVILANSINYLNDFQKNYSKEINIPFSFMERAENVSEKKLKIIKNAGADLISIGIESGDEKLRRNLLNRKQSQETIINAFRIAHKFNLKTNAFTMIGFPTENRSSLKKTLDLVKKAKPNNIQTTIFHPLKSTELYNFVVKEELLDQNSEMNSNYYFSSPLNYSFLWKLELKVWQKIISNYSDLKIQKKYSTNLRLFLYIKKYVVKSLIITFYRIIRKRIKMLYSKY